MKLLVSFLIAMVCVYAPKTQAQSLCEGLFVNIANVEAKYSKEFNPKASAFQNIFKTVRGFFITKLSRIEIQDIQRSRDLKTLHRYLFRYERDKVDIANLLLEDRILINGKKVQLAMDLLTKQGVHYEVIHGETILDSKQNYRNIDNPDFIAIRILPSDESPLNKVAKDVSEKYQRELAYFPFYNGAVKAEASVFKNFLLLSYRGLDNFDLARNEFLTHEIEHISSGEIDIAIKKEGQVGDVNSVQALRYPEVRTSEMDAYLRTLRAIIGKILKDQRTTRVVSDADFDSLKYYALTLSQISGMVLSTKSDPTFDISFVNSEMDPSLDLYLAVAQVRAQMIQAQAQVIEVVLLDLNSQTNALRLRKSLLSLLSVMGKYDPLDVNSFVDFYQIYLENLAVDSDPQ